MLTQCIKNNECTNNNYDVNADSVIDGADLNIILREYKALIEGGTTTQWKKVHQTTDLHCVFLLFYFFALFLFLLY